jgi:hypothetical protein
MSQLSPQDKLNLAAYLESATVSLAMSQAVLPIAKDDGLKKFIEGSISAGESQIKGVQEFLKSYERS